MRIDVNNIYEDYNEEESQDEYAGYNMEGDDNLYYEDEEGVHMRRIIPCWWCTGGKVECDCTGEMGPAWADFDCYACGGEGIIDCPKCDGRGYLIDE